MTRRQNTIAAGAFKQGCLAILDEVYTSGLEVVITKRGKPVARLVPIERAEDRERNILAELRGTARILANDDELLRPSSHDAPWAIHDGD